MNVIFVTICRITNVNDKDINTDLMRKFRDDGHKVYVVSPRERRFKAETSMEEQEGIYILGVKTLNIQKTNVIEKGLGTVLVENQFKNAIKKYLGDIHFDLILFTTPPITFPNVIKYLKKKNPTAKTYLMLKDIFPQNAVDLGMFSKNSPFYWYFRRKEVSTYKDCDVIGCMSPANVEFLKKHNTYLDHQIVEECVNGFQIQEDTRTEEQKELDSLEVRKKYNLPTDKSIVIYGGNLGKPQGIPFLIECLKANSKRIDCHFVVVGDGTEFPLIQNWMDADKQTNVSLFKRLPKTDYDMLVKSCNIGLIFLDHRFTIPNYPSRILSYMEYKMPVICATDVNSDIGTIAEKNGYGLWCESNDVNAFTLCLDNILHDKDKMIKMGEAGYEYMKKNYQADNAYQSIISHF